jgi:hypothetical protein
MISEKESPPTKVAERDVLATRGLRLPQITLRNLRSSGIYCQPSVSIELQHLAGCYLLRGTESGGAVSNLGAYCSFVGTGGQALCCLQRVDSIAVNGVHAIMIAPKVVRLQMLRVRLTYDLLITQHFLEQTPAARRPALRNSILFYGRRGTLEMDLYKDSGYIGMVRPVFFSRGGEPVEEVPPIFAESVLKITAAVNCVGCRHSHLLQPGTSKIPETVARELAEVS